MTAPTTAAMAAALVKYDGARPADSELLAAMMLDRLVYQEGGGATVMTPQGHPAFHDDGSPVAPADLLARFRKEMPGFFDKAKEPDVEVAPAGETLTARVAREARAARKTTKNTDAAQVANPWRKGPSFSVTHQVLMQVRDPALAAKMQEAARAS